MTITALPPAPSRQDPANFANEADAWVAALDQFTTEANALQTDVNAKQVTASTAASTATTQATNASNSASAASISATNASNSASAASTSATNASNSALLAVANTVLNKFTFSSTVTMTDPGVGFVRLNNATLASVTSVALDAQTSDSGNPNILNLLLTHGDSTSQVKGYLKFTKAGTPSTFIVLAITALTNNTTWVQYAVTHIASSGTFTNNDAVVMEFSRTGDAGTGDVTSNSVQTLTNKTIDYSTNTLTGVQPTLVSGTTIKTINSTSLLGSGDIIVGTGDVTLSGTQTLTNKTISVDSNTISGIVASSFVISNASGNINGAAAQKAIPAGIVVGTTDTQTLTNKTIEAASLTNGYTEEVFAVTGTAPALSPANGSIQTWTLTANSTPTAGTWNSGQSITLMIDDGTASTITWTSLAVTWKTNGGSAPALVTAGYTVIALWKVGTVIYGARVGDA